MSSNLKIGFLGLGKMGHSLASSSGKWKLFGYDVVRPSSLPSGLVWTQSISDLEREADVIILCVKPVDMKSAVSQLTGEKKYISIAAGLSTATLQSYFTRHEVSIARAMPSIGALIGKSVSAVYCKDPQLQKIAMEIFSSTGDAVLIEKEDKMHAITGLSGSGPAYVFAFLHALAEGGVLCGLSYEEALRLACSTVETSAAMVRELKRHPGELRNMVTSPAGTTIAGLMELEKGAFHSDVASAVQAAAERSRALGQ